MCSPLHTLQCASNSVQCESDSVLCASDTAVCSVHLCASDSVQCVRCAKQKVELLQPREVIPPSLHCLLLQIILINTDDILTTIVMTQDFDGNISALI